MRIRIFLLCSMLSAALLGGQAAAEAPVVIKFSHVVASDTPKGKAAQRFKELAEAAGKGRLKVELYPNSSLYKDKEELEALQLGAVQMLAPSLAKFGPLGIKEFEVFDLPYIFPNTATLHAVTTGPIGRDLLKKLEPKGITGLAFWDNGFKAMSANRPLHRPADMSGLRFRIQSSKVLDTQMRTLNTRPQMLPFSEVYPALQSGLIDGSENPPSNFYTQKMYQVQKHLTLTNHGYLGYAVIVNKKFWDELPRDLREILETAMKTATQYEYTIAQQDNEQALELIRQTHKTKVYTPNDKEMAEWRQMLTPIQQEMEGRIGKELIQKVNAEAARQEKR